jgi:hypothetical protein
MANTPDDSGHRAVAGYFYQALLTSAMPVELLGLANRDDTGDGFELILAVYSEEHGQDAVAIARGKTTLMAKVVQHKFSAWPEHPNNCIQPQELFEIIDKLSEAAKRIKDRYNCEPHMCLHTNRSLSPQARQFIEDSKANRDNDDLDSTVERTEGKGRKKRVHNKGRSLEKNKIYRQCLKKLEYEVKSVSDAIEALNQRAASFGVLPEEVNGRLSRIEGEIFGRMTHAGLREITLADLDRWLTGDGAPEVICSTRTVECMRAEIDNSGAYLQSLNPLLRRVKQQDLASAHMNPVVLIVGDGGVGKSALVFQYLSSLLKDPPTRYVAACDVRSASDSWCGTLFCRWRNSTDQGLRLSDPESIIRRLDLATRNGEKPILLLWIDGVDERDSEIRLLQAIGPLQPLLQSEKTHCERTGDAPRLQLILTCRTAQDYELRFGNEDQFGDGYRQAAVIDMTQFTADELSTLPQGFLPDSVARRLQGCFASRSARKIATLDPGGDRLGVLKYEDAEPFLHPPLMAALRKVDEVVANKCLNRDNTAMSQVAGQYLKWFANKVCRRFRALKASRVFLQLEQIEVATRRVRPPFRYSEHWKSPAVLCGFTDLEALDLYDEARSAGLIHSEGSQTWRWRNTYVVLGIRANTVQEEVVS